MPIPIYLDHHATTPVEDRVVEAMRPWLTHEFGNAASGHRMGRAAADAVETARAHVAAAIGARPAEVVFTAGATEANFIAIVGAGLAGLRRRGADRVITTAIEHKSVVSACRHLADFHGMAVTQVPVDGAGRVDVVDMEAALTDTTAVVSVMHANNEIGTVEPVADLLAAGRRRGAVTHTDATQGVAWLPTSVDDLNADLLSLSAHKLYGPKGIGALYVRDGVPVVPVLSGGGQERGLRGGTHNVPGIVGFGEACRIVAAERDADAARVAALRDRLEARLLAARPDIVVNGDRANRLPNNLNVSVPGLLGTRMLAVTEEVMLAAASACTGTAGSHVLRAIGVQEDMASGTLRLGLGRHTTDEDVDRVADIVLSALASGSYRVTA